MAIRSGIPLMHVHLGNVILKTNPAQALAEFQLVAGLQANLPKAQRQIHSQVRLHALLLRKQAEAYGELGQYAAAHLLFQQVGR